MMKPDVPSSSPDKRLMGVYEGTRESLFPLAFRTGFLTLVTLGLYRFWERTRIRRYVWSSVAPGGDPFEYTGTGLEKLLGFLVAVVILAVTLGLVQIALMFAGLSVVAPGGGDMAGFTSQGLFLASFLLLVPLGHFARYRARRYRLARTRWRGIRFGMQPGAIGYAWRATLYMLVTVVTFGLLWPLMTFRLEKYQTDRTYFGSARFHQGGRWTMLFPAMKQIGIGVAIMLAGFVLFLAGNGFLSFIAIIVGPVWAGLGAIHYRATAYRILTSHKMLDEDIRLDSDVDGGRATRIVLKGMLAVVLLGALLSMAFAGVLATFGLAETVSVMTATGEMIEPTLFQSILSIFGALLTFLMYGVLYLLYVQQPLLAYQVRHTWVENPIGLTAIGQRNSDDFADADGFADALDVGGAF